MTTPLSKNDAAKGVESPANPHDGVLQEVRFAVVMYGGISLAIYMNGIAQELLAMVRATSGAAVKPGSSEAVYREIAEMLPGSDTTTGDGVIRTRFVVDIISGTSAGGINGIFLAKALANGESIKPLEDLWIKEGDVNTLLADERSGLLSGNYPEALFDGQHMYEILHKAMQETSATQTETLLADTDELDLYVTATDLAGRDQSVELSGGTEVSEKIHRSVFRFSWRGEDSNDFGPENVPFLAFSARCTSSIPPAFPAFRLLDAEKKLGNHNFEKDAAGSWKKVNWDERLDRKQWAKFCRDYLESYAQGSDQEKRDAMEVFAQRSFGDGGYLDNKPFTYATQNLARRRSSDVPVRRHLLFVEPSPEVKLEGEEKIADKPNILRNAMLAISSLPRHETIWEDIRAVQQRNETLREIEDRLADIPDDVRRSLARKRATVATGKGHGWLPTDVKLGEARFGFGFQAYQRLRVDETFAGLSTLLADCCGLLEGSKHELQLRKTLEEHLTANFGDGKRMVLQKSEETFLELYEVGYQLRYLQFCGRLLTRLAGNGAERLWKDFWQQNGVPNAKLDTVWLAFKKKKDGNLPAYLNSLKLQKTKVSEALRGFRHQRRRFVKENQTAILPSGAAFLELLQHVRNAVQILAQNADLAFSAPPQPYRAPESPFDELELLLHTYSGFFGYYDFVSFPLLFRTGGENTNPVTIHRVSKIEGEKNASGWAKPLPVEGEQIAAFGAFFKKEWRENDILAGRLHGAACLIKALLPEDFDSAKRLALVHKAQEAIYREQLQAIRKRVERDLFFPDSFATLQENGRNDMPADNAEMAKLLSRTTRIAGRMLRGISIDRDPWKRFVWLERVGSIAIHLLNAATPKSFASIFTNHLIGLGYLVAMVFALFAMIGKLSWQIPLSIIGFVWVVDLALFNIEVFLHRTTPELRRKWCVVYVGLLVSFSMVTCFAYGVDEFSGKIWNVIRLIQVWFDSTWNRLIT